jgi:hypothetical protein
MSFPVSIKLLSGKILTIEYDSYFIESYPFEYLYKELNLYFQNNLENLLDSSDSKDIENIYKTGYCFCDDFDDLSFSYKTTGLVPFTIFKCNNCDNCENDSDNKDCDNCDNKVKKGDMFGIYFENNLGAFVSFNLTNHIRDEWTYTKEEETYYYLTTYAISLEISYYDEVFKRFYINILQAEDGKKKKFFPFHRAKVIHVSQKEYDMVFDDFDDSDDNFKKGSLTSLEEAICEELLHIDDLKIVKEDTIIALAKRLVEYNKWSKTESNE